MRLLWTVTQRKATLCSSRYTHINNTHMLTHTHMRIHQCFHRRTQKHTQVKITAKQVVWLCFCYTKHSLDFIHEAHYHTRAHTHMRTFFPAWLCLFESVSWWEMWLLHKQTEQLRADISVCVWRRDAVWWISVCPVFQQTHTHKFVQLSLRGLYSDFHIFVQPNPYPYPNLNQFLP